MEDSIYVRIHEALHKDSTISIENRLYFPQIFYYRNRAIKYIFYEGIIFIEQDFWMTSSPFCKMTRLGDKITWGIRESHWLYIRTPNNLDKVIVGLDPRNSKNKRNARLRLKKIISINTKNFNLCSNNYALSREDYLKAIKPNTDNTKILNAIKKKIYLNENEHKISYKTISSVKLNELTYLKIHYALHANKSLNLNDQSSILDNIINGKRRISYKNIIFLKQDKIGVNMFSKMAREGAYITLGVRSGKWIIIKTSNDNSMETQIDFTN